MSIGLLDVVRHRDHAEPLTVERIDDSDNTALCNRFTKEGNWVKTWFPIRELRPWLVAAVPRWESPS